VVQASCQRTLSTLAIATDGCSMSSAVGAVYASVLVLLVVRVGIAVVAVYQRWAHRRATFRGVPLPPGPPQGQGLSPEKRKLRAQAQVQVWRTYAAWKESYGSYLCFIGSLTRILNCCR